MWRQLGNADRARMLDERGRTEAVDEVTRVDAQVGLAADAVASNQLALANRILVDITVPSSTPRVHIRHLWVRAECALAEGRHEVAQHNALEAIAASRTYGSRRHLVKSQLIHAVIESDNTQVIACAQVAADAQWRYLAWAATTYLGFELGGSWLQWSRTLAHAISERLNPEQGVAWAANPAVEAVRARVALHYV